MKFSIYLNRRVFIMIGYYRIYEWRVNGVRYFEHVQDDLNLCILHMLNTILPDVAPIMLVAHDGGTANEHPQHTFSQRNKKNQ